MVHEEQDNASTSSAWTGLVRTGLGKKVYIYGALDIGPTILNRAFGLTWDLAGWLLTPFMAKAGMEIVGRMRMRVAKDLTTTFASHYAMRGSLEDMLTRDAVSVYNARRTGEKYLVVP
jgi:NADPH:quinone reductase